MNIFFFTLLISSILLMVYSLESSVHLYRIIRHTTVLGSYRTSILADTYALLALRTADSEETLLSLLFVVSLMCSKDQNFSPNK